MPAWFLNPALSRFRAEVNARWPNRDKASDGTIGDAAHQATNSDHNPDPNGSVDAWDMDVDGPDIGLCKKVFEAHEASSYWIHNDRISFRSEGWAPRSYSYAGPNRNRHTQHVHWNSRQAAENSTKPWFPPLPTPAPEVPDMVRLKAKDDSARYLSNGAHIPSMAVDALLEAKGVPLVEVDTTAELLALLPPAAAPVVVEYGPLGEAVLVALLRAAGQQS